MTFDKTFRSEKLRRAVSELSCQRCGREGMTQAAHCDQGKGMGIKSSDATIYAACVECHAEIGSSGRIAKDDRRALEDWLNLKTLRLLIENGTLKA